ncbi:uncharacterized protein [Halyomorpha halys]|uniref:uncharacterized protein isoform X2 n=1 Tax=Halyomorpha halys TaxID=286706 RepID=UPI0006D4D053|nr:uncharacterized protein LOC106679420 isoform X2 [Halyomorpha halys]
MEFLDSDLIILEVQKFPCLYDTSNFNFKNREMRREAWMTVTKNVMGEKWEQFDENTRSNTAKEVQKRWRSMKDSFFKSLKSEIGKSCEARKPKKPYIYHKQMAFLHGLYRPRETLGNMDADSENTEEYEAPEVIIEESIADQSIVHMLKKRKSDSSETEIVNLSNVKLEQETKKVIQDPDEMFLLSQLPNIKKMTQSDKLRFQIKFLELIQTYCNPDS